MTIFCKYHPTKPAHWTCPHCNIAFCPDCVSVKKTYGATSGHLCPRCKKPVEWVGVSNLIEPFWRRWSKFFLYPFSVHPFVLILILSVLSVLPLGGIPGLMKPLIVWGMLFNYAFAALKYTARGNLRPPELDTFLGNVSGRVSLHFLQSLVIVFKQFGIYVAIGLLFGVLTKFLGIIAGIIFLVAALLFVPAMIILLATTDSLIQAVNPTLFCGLAFRLGKSYLLMYFFLFLLGTAPAALWGAIHTVLPDILGPFVLSVAECYYTIVSYHLMGYVLLQYHEEVGYRVDYEDFHDPTAGTPEGDTPGNALVRQVDVQLKEGNFDEALCLIEASADGNGVVRDPQIAGRYFKLLALKKRTPQMLAHGKTWLEQLVRADEKGKACQVYLSCAAADKAFVPSAQALFKLGSWLREAGKNKAAIAAYNRFVKAYPTAPTVPTACFRAAEIFHGKLNNTPKARQLLTGLVKKYPDHDIIPFVREYLNHL
ncbi:hypothetical protein DENIS_4057 [Desulfonema ishimotonii]|uniref:Uncharacterized protein n=1 Tax=Desulfonema ishimotonii TaxID=45657 RepID=A0A401G1F3_9BACT|nr:tetratricopeptide repeat protein [Desulfonema ishimotonii]GBC63068.1 hypothetical protein DENIS_4057 [Desulfonema ishimotonii]